MERVSLEHGSGGALSRDLVEKLIFPYFSSESFAELGDAALINISTRAALTTDSYVVDPLFFPGGDIGKLAVFGTCNDLAVSGARPLYMTLALIIEEGLPFTDLEKILASIQSAAREAQVKIVSGDTKVVPRGKGGAIFINTSGVGKIEFSGTLSPARLRAGDAVLISGPVGSHGLAVFGAREGIKQAASLSTDCAHLYPLCHSLYALGDGLRFMRDATRGGLAAVLNETVSGQNCGIIIEEHAVPVLPRVKDIAEILGMNPMEIANEGVFIAVTAPKVAEAAVLKLRASALGQKAAVIGTVNAEYGGKVVLKTAIGGKRRLDYPRGLLLPRIC